MGCWIRQTPAASGLSDAMAEALDAVAEIGRNGLIVLPTEPSAAMLAAGARAGGVSPDVAWCIYQAMIYEAE